MDMSAEVLKTPRQGPFCYPMGIRTAFRVDVKSNPQIKTSVCRDYAVHCKVYTNT